MFSSDSIELNIFKDEELFELEKKLRYRLITGKDDSSFCQRISALLDDGYELYGSPASTFNGKDVIVAQAVILKSVEE